MKWSPWHRDRVETLDATLHVATHIAQRELPKQITAVITVTRRCFF